MSIVGEKVWERILCNPFFRYEPRSLTDLRKGFVFKWWWLYSLVFYLFIFVSSECLLSNHSANRGKTSIVTLHDWCVCDFERNDIGEARRNKLFTLIYAAKLIDLAPAKKTVKKMYALEVKLTGTHPGMQTLLGRRHSTIKGKLDSCSDSSNKFFNPSIWTHLGIRKLGRKRERLSSFQKGLNFISGWTAFTGPGQ